MGKKDTSELDFEQLVHRLHGSGDLRIFKTYIKLLKDECKTRRYDPKVVESRQTLAFVTGEECSYDHLLEQFEDILGS